MAKKPVQKRIKTVNNEGFKQGERNPWRMMIKPLLKHESFIDQDGNKFEYIDEKICTDDRYGKRNNGRWGQLLYKCNADDSYWRLGFTNLHNHNHTTEPDSYSCHMYYKALVLTQH